MYSNYLINPEENNEPMDLAVKIAGYYERVGDHFIDRPENDLCEDFIYILCIEGEGTVKSGDKSIRIKRKHAILIDGNTPHSYYSNEKNPWSILWCHVQGEFVQEITKAFDMVRSIRVIEFSEEIFLEQVEWMHRMIQHIKSPLHKYSFLAAQNFIRLIFSELIQLKADGTDGTLNHEHIASSVEYMKHNIYTQLSLDQMCEEVHLSKYYFCHEFKKATGFTPIAYFNKLKIMKACELLVEEDYLIQQVSEILNFSSPFYFSETFKKYTGFSPRMFKKTIQREH